MNKSTTPLSSHPLSRVASFSHQWTNQKQQDLERRLGRITASCRFPFTWIQHPEVIQLFDLIAPYATLPSRFKLLRQIIPNLAAEFREKSKVQAANGFATIQGDGWTGINNHHLNAFMIGVNSKVFLLCYCQNINLSYI